MSDKPELLSPKRLAEIEALLLIGDAVVGDLVNADDVRALLASYKGQRLLYQETSRIANKQRNQLAAYRTLVAEQLGQVIEKAEHFSTIFNQDSVGGKAVFDGRAMIIKQLREAATALGITLP